MNMKGASINYDLDKVLESLGPAEQNYAEHLKLDDSFMGWLLTLNKEEFDYVYKNMTHDFVNYPNDGETFLFTQIEMHKRGQSMILYEDLIKDMDLKKGLVQLIDMVRKGLLTYTPAETDLLWEFQATPKGLEVQRKLMILENLKQHGKDKPSGDKPDSDTIGTE